MLSEPLRSCVGCRTRRGQSALVRITRVRGTIEVGGPSAGRGAWVCRLPDGETSDRDRPGVAGACVESAIERGAFARAWRGPVSAAEYELIRSATGVGGIGRNDESPDAR